MTQQPEIYNDWLPHLMPFFEQTPMHELKSFLHSELQKKQPFFPPSKQIFAAFNQTSFADTKVIILGQDPYHGAGQANGLSFSVSPPTALPPSLMNIYQELHDDLKIQPARHGDLSAWAQQGVLLLNSALTVRAHQANSHQNKGWECLTDGAIHTLSQEKSNLVFILWGRFAQNKANLIDEQRHLIIRSAHPSPLSAYRGFLGSHPFSRANLYLSEHALTPIDWRLPTEPQDT